MDGGAWWAAVHEVAKSRTRLRDITFTFHFHALRKEVATHSSVLSWRVPGTGEPDGLPSMGLHRVGHDWSDLAAAEKPCFLQGQKSLALHLNKSGWIFKVNLGSHMWYKKLFKELLSRRLHNPPWPSTLGTGQVSIFPSLPLCSGTYNTFCYCFPTIFLQNCPPFYNLRILKIQEPGLTRWFFFFWGIVDLQCCINFSCTAKWFCYIDILFHILFHYGLSQDIEYSSLCYTVGT